VLIFPFGVRGGVRGGVKTDLVGVRFGVSKWMGVPGADKEAGLAEVSRRIRVANRMRGCSGSLAR
jgi:hypothetical protein